MTSRFIPEKSKKPKPELEAGDGDAGKAPKKAKPAPRKASVGVDVPTLKPDQRKSLIQADWESAATFEVIKKKMNLSTEQLVELFKTLVGPRDFRRWRRKVEAHGHVSVKRPAK